MRPRPTVYKFGGSSLADAGRIRAVAELVARGPRPLVVVVSAMGGTTDTLSALCRGDAAPGGMEELEGRYRELTEEMDLDAEVGDEGRARLRRLASDLEADPSPARDDSVLSCGEDLSAPVVAAAVRAAGADAVAVDSRRIIRTDSRFGAGIPEAQTLRALAREVLPPHLLGGKVVVTQGFVGATSDGRTTTLGRGGSDFTAALLGGALDAETVHIWTDVDGVFSGDPRHVGRPRLVEELGFEEAVELCWAGASVLHPVAAKWAVSQGVPLRIRSTFHPERPGTVVRNDVREAATIAAVTAKPDVTLLKVRSRPWALPYGFLARVFDVLAGYRLEVDLVATSHSSTSLTLDGAADLTSLERELGAFAEVESRSGLTTVTVVGHGLLASPRENARVFATLADTPVHLISQASDVSVSVVVDEDRADEVVERLHRALVEEGDGPGASEDASAGEGSDEAPTERGRSGTT